MYFSKIELHRDADVIRRVARILALDGYGVHQAIWRLFQDGGNTQRDFLYRCVETDQFPYFFVVSKREPVDEQGLWSIQVKNYAPRLVNDQRLAFSLCANPVITKPGRGGKPVRHDVVMNTKKQLREKGRSISQAALIQKAGSEWLEKRAAQNGFCIERVRVDGYRQHRLLKPRREHSVQFSSVDLNGLLTVVDAEQLQHALVNGIGPAKGFGCGLLLIRPVSF